MTTDHWKSAIAKAIGKYKNSVVIQIASIDPSSPRPHIIPNPHVQVAWWIEGTQEQFRISGLACIIPAPSNDLYRYFLHNAKIAPKGSAVAMLNAEGFDWEEKRKAVFHSLSGYMKATWCRPVPGSLLDDYESAKSWPEKLEEPQDGDDERTGQVWTTALQNFALLVIEPTEVDYLELGVVPNRRTRFWRTNGGSWDSELLVP